MCDPPRSRTFLGQKTLVIATTCYQLHLTGLHTAILPFSSRWKLFRNRLRLKIFMKVKIIFLLFNSRPKKLSKLEKLQVTIGFHLLNRIDFLKDMSFFTHIIFSWRSCFFCRKYHEIIFFVIIRILRKKKSPTWILVLTLSLLLRTFFVTAQRSLIVFPFCSAAKVISPWKWFTSQDHSSIFLAEYDYPIYWKM